MTLSTLASTSGTRWAALVATSLVLTSCRDGSARKFVAVPLGLGAEMHLRVPGAGNAAPSIVGDWPFAVVAWTATTPEDSVVYVAMSVDNGASFSSPRPIEASRTRTKADAALVPRVVFGWQKAGANYEPLMPDVHIVWRIGTERGAAVRSVKSTDAGRSFIDEAMDHERPVDLPLQSQRAPSPEQLSLAVADVTSAQPRGTFDDCGTLLVVWDEAGAGTPRVAMRRLLEGPKDVFHALQTVTVGSQPSASRPDVASLLGGVIVAWTSGVAQESAITLRRVGLESICQPQVATSGRASDAATP